MNRVRVLVSQLAALVTGHRADRDLRLEIEAHLDLLAEEYERRGLSRQDARLAARREFGGVEQVRQACREQRGLRLVDTVAQDLRQGLRIARTDPKFSAIAVLTLALGISAATLVFSFLTAVSTANAPVPDMDRLVGVWSHNRGQGQPKAVVSAEDFIEWGRRQRSFDRFAAVAEGAVNLSGGDRPVRATASFVTPDYFDMLAPHMALGRALRTADGERGAPLVAVLSNRFWRDRFAASPAALGRDIRVDGRPAVIVGVLPRDGFSRDLILPLLLGPPSRDSARHSLFVMARRRDGVTFDQAGADMRNIGAQLERERPETHRGWGVNVRPLQDEFLGPEARLVFVLLSASAGAILLIGCANIANLLLARGVTRGRELAIRAALGANRLRLVRQMLTESAVLALAGAAMGLVLAHWGLGVLRAAFAMDAAIVERAVINGRVLAFAAVVSMGATLFFGLLPALRGASGHVPDTLREGSRASHGVRTRRLASVLVGGEVAAAVLLLVVALLLMRTLAALERIEPGFDATQILTMRVTLPETRYPDDASIVSFYDRVVERLRSARGVVQAGAAMRVPAAGSRFNPDRSVVIQGRAARAGETLFAADLTVMPGYLEALRIPVHAGRSLDARDAAGAPLAVVVSETMVRRYWGGARAKALGARIRLGDEALPDGWRTVVGVAGDVRNDDIDAPPLPQVYVPLAQRPSREMTVVIRTADDPLAHVAEARAAFAAIDADQPIYDVKSMAQILDEDLLETVVFVTVLGVFAGVALLLASVGVYGVASRAVAQRTRELGVRMALGATAGEVAWMLIRQGGVPVAAGLILGVGCSIAVVRLIGGLLYGVAPIDPVTYGGAILLLALTALIACVAPARRAASVGPLAALRED